MADIFVARDALEHIRTLAARDPRNPESAAFILHEIIRHARAAYDDPAMRLVRSIAAMTATGDTECNGEPLDEPWRHDPDDAMETMDSLITRARDITKGA